jgi:hypothetical protein
MRWAAHTADMRESGIVNMAMERKTEGKRPLGRPRHRWENNTKMAIQAVEWGGMDWIDLAQDRDKWRALVNAVMNLRIQ